MEKLKEGVNQYLKEIAVEHDKKLYSEYEKLESETITFSRLKHYKEFENDRLYTKRAVIKVRGSSSFGEQTFLNKSVWREAEQDVAYDKFGAKIGSWDMIFDYFPEASFDEVFSMITVYEEPVYVENDFISHDDAKKEFIRYVKEASKKPVQFSWVFKNKITCYIEYKSSIEESKKGIDDILRQIKRRIAHTNKKGGSIVILMSFDRRFEKFKALFEKEGVKLSIPNEELKKTILKEMN